MKTGHAPFNPRTTERAFKHNHICNEDASVDVFGLRIRKANHRRVASYTVRHTSHLRV
jgi:hypothetical protein